MKATEIKADQQFESYYGNGHRIGISKVTRVTEHSIFYSSTNTVGFQFNETRVSVKHVQKFLDTKMWIPIV